jgi:hypothetical protein
LDNLILLLLNVLEHDTPLLSENWFLAGCVAEFEMNKCTSISARNSFDAEMQIPLAMILERMMNAQFSYIS